MNQFQHYRNIIKVRLPWLVLVSGLVALIVYGFAGRIKPEFEVHFSYVVALSQREAVPSFRYDGYYALQTTDLFAGTIAGWVNSPEIIAAAFQHSDEKLPSQDPRQLTKLVSAEKAAPQLVRVTVKNISQSKAEKIAAGLQLEIEKNIKTYNLQGISVADYKVTSTKPWTGLTTVSPGIIAVATFVFFLFFGINAVLLYESFKREN